ncbi:MAG: hypothetical protein R3B47_08550 [Bacteroidia bacterium]
MNELQHIFQNHLQIVQLEEVECVLEEGSHHEGRAFTLRFVGIK